ncbi:MAG: hypothetical protein KatS3mg118_0546 [Paracoccaceae bacterium]|nr:MAG: hypothetical protein KatS3mg118_0546 [Paracoccaceae bacterium]
MRRILRVLTSTTFLVLFFTTLLALTIWFLGPVLGAAGIYPLEGVLARVIAIALIYLLAIIAILVTLLRRRRTEAGMVEAITAESAEDPADAAARAEIARAAHAHARGAGAAAPVAPWRALRPAPCLSAALVHHHRPARRGQDHGDHPLGPAVPAGRPHGAEAGGRGSAARATATGGSPTRRC